MQSQSPRKTVEAQDKRQGSFTIETKDNTING